MNTQTIELDINKRGCGNNCIRIAQGESGGTTIKALVYDNGAEMALTGYTAYLVARLPDRNHYYRGSATVSGNAITYVADESKLASAAGYTDEAYFELIKGSSKAQTERFALDILRDARDGQKPAETWDTEVKQLVDRANNAVSNAEDAVTAANEVMASAGTAVTNANTAAKSANTAADKADTATKNANTAKTNAETATKKANTAADKADASAGKADDAAKAASDAKAEALKAAEEARGSVSADRKFYFKRITDDNGDTRPVIVDMTIS